MLLIVVEAVCLLSPMHTGNNSCKYVLLYILQKLKFEIYFMPVPVMSSW